jgi:Sulfotransferase domain
MHQAPVPADATEPTESGLNRVTTASLKPTARPHDAHTGDGTAGLPSFLVIGAQRAGSTLLHCVLDSHPEVFVPYRRKEIHYFDVHFDRGVQWYRTFFPSLDEAGQYRAIGEVTPDYLFEPRAPRRIHELLPNCRLIVSLRNPVNRAYSSYLYSVRSRNERRSFAEVMAQDADVLQRGFYSEQLERYLHYFPRELLLILIHEEIVSSPREQLQRIADFLGLQKGWDDPDALMRERVNTSDIPRFRTAFAYARRVGALLTRSDVDWVVRLAKRSGLPKMFGRQAVFPPLAPEHRRKLQDLYRPEIEALEALLGRELPSWRGDRSASPLPAAEP